jgi:hypothetical protein
LLTNRAQLAERFAASMLNRAKSYMFSMELGLLLGRFDKFSLAKTAYETARRRAAESTIRMDPFDKRLPIVSKKSAIILPRDAVIICDRVLKKITSSTSGSSNINLFDYRIYCPGHRAYPVRRRSRTTTVDHGDGATRSEAGGPIGRRDVVLRIGGMDVGRRTTRRN